eukprot:1183418-Prorocentrum_minimum.AAC.1
MEELLLIDVERTACYIVFKNACGLLDVIYITSSPRRGTWGLHPVGVDDPDDWVAPLLLCQRYNALAEKYVSEEDIFYLPSRGNLLAGDTSPRLLNPLAASHTQPTDKHGER